MIVLVVFLCNNVYLYLLLKIEMFWYINLSKYY